MGLSEKRLLEEYKKIFNDKEAPKLKSLGGLNLELEVAWDQMMDQFTDVGMPEVEEYFAEVFIKPTVAAVKSACADELGLSLIKPALKKLVFCCSADIDYNPNAMSFSGGVLKIDHSRRKTNQEEFTQERIVFLTELIEDAL